ncbi:MAG TPA: NAD(P)-dependent oxidoreductase [Candidatus Nanoarchaeia archaeon]|nr:NAD(P)-dependent oxidoreductase [Candidatus Nanoarchaeia archaeon]
MTIIKTDYQPPEYVVTGAAGFIGSQMVQHLLSHKKRVRATDLREPSWLKAHQKERESGQLEFVAADLTDAPSLEKVVRGTKYLHHIGALFHHAASYDDLMRVNADGTKNICTAALRNDLERIVHVGSMTIYGHNQVPEKGAKYAITEQKKPDPADHYAFSKQRSREIAANFNGWQGLQVCIVDPAGVFGPQSTYGNVSIIKMLLDGMMLLPDGGKHQASMVHSYDVVRLCDFLMQTNITHDSNEPQVLSYLASDYTPVTGRELMDGIWKKIPKELQHNFARKITEHVPVREWWLLPVAHLADTVAKIYNATLRKAVKGHIWHPELDPRAIKYGFGDHSASPEKAKNAGFRHCYPETWQTINEVMDWHTYHGLIKERLEKKKKK